MHLNFVSDRWWRLRILYLMDCIACLLVNVIFTSTRCCASGVRVNTSNSLVLWCMPRCAQIIRIWFYLLNGIFHFRNIDGASIVASLAVTTDFIVGNYSSRWVWSGQLICFERTLSMNRCQERVISVNLLSRRARINFFHINVVIVVLITVLINGLIFNSLLMLAFLVVIVLSTRWIVLICLLLLVVQRVLTVQVHEVAPTVVLFHHWILLYLVRPIFQIVIFTSASCVIVTCLTKWILVAHVEILNLTFLSNLFCFIRPNFLSLVD